MKPSRYTHNPLQSGEDGEEFSMELGGMGQFDTIDFTDEQDVQVPHPPSNLQQLCNVWVRGKFTRAAISVFIGFTILWPILLISLFVGYEKSCACLASFVESRPTGGNTSTVAGEPCLIRATPSPQGSHRCRSLPPAPARS